MPESVSQSIRTSSARRRNGLSLACASNQLALGARGHADGLDRLDAEGLDEGLGHGASCTGFSSAASQCRSRGRGVGYFQRAASALPRGPCDEVAAKSTPCPRCDAVMPWPQLAAAAAAPQFQPPQAADAVQRRTWLDFGAPARVPLHACAGRPARRRALVIHPTVWAAAAGAAVWGEAWQAAGLAWCCMCSTPARTARCGRKAGCAAERPAPCGQHERVPGAHRRRPLPARRDRAPQPRLRALGARADGRDRLLRPLLRRA